MLLLVAVVGSAGYVYHRGRSSLPQIDGTLTLAGLSASVEVLRDRGIDLVGFEIELVSIDNREALLKNSLEGIKDDFQFAFVD